MRLGLIASLLCLCTLSLCLADPAKAAIRKDLDVPPEDLSPALQTVATTYELQVLYPTQVAKDLKTHGAIGSFTPDDALKTVLSGTGLSYKYLDANTVTVFATAAPAGVTAAAGQDQTNTTQDNSKEAGKKSSQDFRVAQVDQGQTSSPSTVENPSDQSPKKKPDYLEEVIVTGSRIPTAAGQLTLPVLSYTRENIENTGQTSVGEFLSTLPDVSTSANSYAQFGFHGFQTVQLHGLPVGTTLTLLDGRRLETNIDGFFDLSNIPLAAVERIEILPVGTSAVYGADGLGGAVNTILRKDFNGLEVSATWNHASDVNNPSANFVWGKNWDRGSVSLIGSYQDLGELLGTQREPTSLTSLPANLPASVVSAITSYSCAPGNVYSVDGSNLPGLSSPEAAIPTGITGRPTIGQFLATAGKQNGCNALRYTDITPHTEREGAVLSAHYDITQSIDIFTEVLASRQNIRAQIASQITAYQSYGGTVAADNPYNPFGEAVNVSFAYPGAGTDEVESMSLIRPLIGIRGTFLSDWHYEATAYFSRDDFHADLSEILPTQIGTALASSNPATALNPFATGAPGSSQLLSSLAAAGYPSYDTFDDRTVSGQVILRGPVFHLPAGAVQAVVGSEYGQEHQDTFIAGELPFFLHRNTYAVFSEARIPLLAGKEPKEPSSGSEERLALTLAGRYDHSDDYGGKGTWQSGLLWRPMETLSFSGSYGLSYQAPQLGEISGPQNTEVFSGGLGYPDPFRGNQLIDYPIKYVSGPNFNLQPETGDAFTLGLQYSSQALTGLHASLTWYDVRISNYISGESIQALLAYPNLFPGAVVRAPPTPQDQQLGWLGAITQFNSLFYNFGDIRVAGFDADIRYAIDTRIGQLTPSVAIANIYKWQSALLPGTAAIDGLGSATFYGVGWSPRWKGTAALAWKQGSLSMNLDGRYIGSYLDYQDFVPNTHEIGNTWIFDFNARYDVGQGVASTHPWLAGSYVAFGAVNLLNKTPPFSYSPYWYDVQEYDIRGRYLHLTAGVRF